MNCPLIPIPINILKIRAKTKGKMVGGAKLAPTRASRGIGLMRNMFRSIKGLQLVSDQSTQKQRIEPRVIPKNYIIAIANVKGHDGSLQKK